MEFQGGQKTKETKAYCAKFAGMKFREGKSPRGNLMGIGRNAKSRVNPNKKLVHSVSSRGDQFPGGPVPTQEQGTRPEAGLVPGEPMEPVARSGLA